MRSMFSGVSSLRVHQTRMDVIANNIANVNTVGFKSQRATFADAFYQRIVGASGPDPTTGRAGTNPQQIGLGLNLASIDNIMTQGATQRTDNAMDITITGPGFFIVEDDSGRFFTRAGNIGLDFQNNLHINGMRLMGWNTEVDPATGRHEVNRSMLTELSLSGDRQNMPSEPTTILDLVGNLNINHLNNRNQAQRSMAIFDSLGNRYLVDVLFTYHPNASAAAGSPHSYWTFEFVREVLNPGDLNAQPTPIQPELGGVLARLEGRTDIPPAQLAICMRRMGMGGLIDANGDADVGSDFENMMTAGTIAFDSRGEVVGIGAAKHGVRVTDPAGTPASWFPLSFMGTSTDIPPTGTVPDPIPPGWTPGTGDSGIRGSIYTPDTTNGYRNIFTMERAFNFFVVPLSGVAPSATFGTTDRSVYVGNDTVITVGQIRMNMGELFGRGGENTTLRALTMDGNGPGTLQDISIGGDGLIMGRFSNGRTRVLGQIPLAVFSNPEGLERVGGNLWTQTANSGQFDGIGQIGSMQGGALEMSNVDLANEFTEMITTQRGFQAASRTISVSDEMLQELVNLRR